MTDEVRYLRDKLCVAEALLYECDKRFKWTRRRLFETRFHPEVMRCLCDLFGEPNLSAVLSHLQMPSSAQHGSEAHMAKDLLDSAQFTHTE